MALGKQTLKGSYMQFPFLEATMAAISSGQVAESIWVQA